MRHGQVSIQKDKLVKNCLAYNLPFERQALWQKLPPVATLNSEGRDWSRSQSVLEGGLYEASNQVAQRGTFFPSQSRDSEPGAESHPSWLHRRALRFLLTAGCGEAPGDPPATQWWRCGTGALMLDGRVACDLGGSRRKSNGGPCCSRGRIPPGRGALYILWM